MKSYLNLNQFEMDILNEIGAISTGNSNIALSKMINKGIKLIPSEIGFFKINEFMKICTENNNLIATIYTELTGDMEGHALFFFEYEDMIKLLQLTFEKYNIVQSDKLDGFAEAAFLEIGSIFVGSYVNTLAKLLNVNITRSTPIIAKENSNHVFEYFLDLAILQSRLPNIKDLFYLKSTVSIEDLDVNGTFLFIPAFKSVQKIIEMAKTLQ